MKELDLEFVKNCDLVGDCTFRQLKKQDSVHLYQRINKDGTTRSYEVFIAKLILKGTRLPGGFIEPDDRYSYPGKGGFGPNAYDCKRLDVAESKFDEFVQRVKDKNDLNAHIEHSDAGEGESDTPHVKTKPIDLFASAKGKRGRKAIDRSSIIIPKDKFSIKQLAALNVGVSAMFLYQHICQMKESGQIVIVEKISSGRGKPTNFYQLKADVVENELTATA